MRVVYLDAALSGELGHFAGVCRSVTAAIRGAGIEAIVCSHQQIDHQLKAELSARPLFRLHPNARLSNDPVCGWLLSYFETVRLTVDDLSRVQGLTAEDVIVYDCARPAQIGALVQWLQQTFVADLCPQLLIMLGWPSGMTVNRDELGQLKSWQLHDQSSCLYRLAVTTLRPAYAGRVRFGVADATAAESYEYLLNRPVEKLPAIQEATIPPRDRSAAADPCVAFLGEQRFDKGYPLVPRIVEALLASDVRLKILVQNSWQQMEEQNAALRAIAARDTRLTVRIGTLPASGWNEQLSEADLIVLPYHPSTYSTTLSGVGAEATANGIPQAVPANTGLSRLLVEYGMPGVVFPQSEPAAVVKAVLEALQDWPALTARAARARELWAERNSPQRLAAAILGRQV